MSVHAGHPDHETQAEHDAWEAGYEAGMEDGWREGHLRGLADADLQHAADNPYAPPEQEQE